MKQNKKAFTLIELMVAMGIIAVLVGMSVFGISIVQRSLRNTERRRALNAVNLGIQQYFNDYGTYPSTSDLVIKNDEILVDGVVIAELTGAAKAGNTTNSSTTEYCYIPTSGSYRLGVNLEGNDWGLQLGDTNQADCTTAYTITP